MLKIVHIHFGKEGGAERFFVNLVTALGQRGVEQRFFIRPGRTWRDAIAPYGEITENNFRYTPSGLWLKARFPARMRRYRPDVIMAWMPRAARLIPKCDGPLRLVRLGDFPRHLTHFTHCDLIVGNTPAICAHCEDLGWTRPTRTITNFPREVPDAAAARADLDTPDDAFVISASGRFVPRKGFDWLLRAAARLPRAFVWLVGDGKERGALEKLARELGIADRVRFTGWVDEPAPLVKASNVFCMPSRHEPLGNVVLEAWKLGVPAVSSRSEGPNWFMTDGRDGLMVDIDDVEGLARALRRIESEDGLAAALVAGATTTLANRFSVESITQQYLDLFQNRLHADDPDVHARWQSTQTQFLRAS